MDAQLKKNLIVKNKWIRGLCMLLFVLIYKIATVLVAAVAVFQFFATLFAGKTNELLMAFGERLSAFIYQIVQFLTFNTEDKPFPFSQWPQGASKVNKRRPAGKKVKTGKAR